MTESGAATAYEIVEIDMLTAPTTANTYEPGAHAAQWRFVPRYSDVLFVNQNVGCLPANFDLAREALAGITLAILTIMPPLVKRSLARRSCPDA
jgi:hypothetical protein